MIAGVPVEKKEVSCISFLLSRFFFDFVVPGFCFCASLLFLHFCSPLFPLYRDPVTRRSPVILGHCYTQALVHTDAFTHRPCHSQTLLHTDSCVHRKVYTQTPLHTYSFTHQHFHTQSLVYLGEFAHKWFTQAGFYSRTVSHTDH